MGLTHGAHFIAFLDDLGGGAELIKVVAYAKYLGVYMGRFCVQMCCLDALAKYIMRVRGIRA